MNKQDLLKFIAQKAYDVGFGAKKHFATYDMVTKLPSFIGFISLCGGILALFVDELSTKSVSAAFTILGIVSLYISFYNEKIQQYNTTGIQLTQLFNRLRILYFRVQSSNTSSFAQEELELQNIENEYYSISNSAQIMFSNWYAHYKFFWEMQIDWINSELKLRFWRDKIPLSMIIAVILIIVAILYILISNKLTCSFK